MLAKIMAFIEAVPRLIDLGERFFEAWKKYKKYEFERDAIVLRKQIDQAETPDEYKQASKDLHDLISRS